MKLFTLGHSNRSLPELLSLLRAHELEQIVDIRSSPRSRRHPSFDKAPLSAALKAQGLQYLHLSDLGGMRPTPPEPGPDGGLDSKWWGYSAHMRSARFTAAVDRLLEVASGRRSALMCAERSHEHCHRHLLCDALLLRGVEVTHVHTEDTTVAHQLHPLATKTGQLYYPPRQAELF